MASRQAGRNAKAGRSAVGLWLGVALVFCIAVNMLIQSRRASGTRAAPHAETTMALERKAVPAPVADWRDPTGGVQPNLANYRNLAIFVNLETNIAAVESNGKVIYRMLTSPGVDGETPTGYWRTDAKGVHFYNEKEHEGADYYTVIHGNYLFHTVPTGRASGTYIASQGDILGQDGSHGCCRLSVADAYWLWKQCPRGTPVYIYDSKKDLDSLLTAHHYADRPVDVKELLAV